MHIIRDWNEFWFKEQSPGPIGLFRIGLGGIFIFWGVLMAPPSIYTWFAEDGPMPLSFYQFYKGSAIELSLFGFVMSHSELFAIWVLFLLAAFCFTIGLFSRSSGLVLFLIFASFSHRDTLMLNSGDTMIRCCLFLMLFSPCGRSCSVDRIIAIARGKDIGGDPALVEVWAQRMLQVQISLVYISSVCSKLSGKDWLNGTAVYYPLHMVELVRFPLPSFFSSDVVINLITWGTLAIEASLALLIWNRNARPYVLAAGVLLHSSIEYALNVPLFSLIMITSYLNFVYNEWITVWVEALSRSFSRYTLAVQLPTGVTAAGRWWLVVERLDALKLLHLAASADSSTADLAVSGADGNDTGLSALRRIVLRFPALWILCPLLLIPGSNRLLMPFVPMRDLVHPVTDHLAPLAG